MWHSEGMSASTNSPAAVRPEAAAIVHDNDAPVGILLLHGITGSPAAWRPIADHLIADGSAVRVPLLPGHGTRWPDLNRTGWDDWCTAARAELDALRAQHPVVLVAGLSMGGALALELATTTTGVDGLVLVNPSLRVDSPLRAVLPALSRVVPSIAAIGNDIARPGEDEVAYPRTPLRAVASMYAGQRRLRHRLWRIIAPTVLCVSGTDHVVGPWSARFLRTRLLGRLRTVALRRSHHVATLDHDADIILEEIRRLRDGLLPVRPQSTGAAPGGEAR